MLAPFQILAELENFIPIIISIIIVILAYILFRIIVNSTKNTLLKKAKTKKQITTIEFFAKILSYLFFIVLLLFALFSYFGDLTGLGLGIGLFSAAIGFALQRPISGIAAWIMMITRRPFEIGDRIIIGKLKGDVIDITLTHIYLHEIGGIVAGEENSGRIIMVPNSILFEQNIINYSMKKEELVLDQVSVPITFESNLKKASEIALNSAKKHIEKFVDKPKREPYIRTYFNPNGLEVNARYFVPAKNLQEYSSKITQEIHTQIIKTKDVKFAYPHREIILDKKTKEKLKKL